MNFWINIGLTATWFIVAGTSAYEFFTNEDVKVRSGWFVGMASSFTLAATYLCLAFAW